MRLASAYTRKNHLPRKYSTFIKQPTFNYPSSIVSAKVDSYYREIQRPFSDCSTFSHCHSHNHLLQHNNEDCTSTRNHPIAMSTFNLSETQLEIASVYNDPNSSNIFSLFATGGGISLSSWLLTVPGASNSVMNIELPYSRYATLDLLSRHGVLNKDSQDDNLAFCSSDMALYLAEAAYRDAIQASSSLTHQFSHMTSTSSSTAATTALHTPHSSSIALNLLTQTQASVATSNQMDETGGHASTMSPPPIKPYNVFGVSCTAALVSGSPKRGAHRCHIAVATANDITTYTLTLDKSLGRSRIEEDTICSQLVLHAIQEQSSQKTRISSRDIRGFPFLADTDQLAIHRNIPRNLIDDVCTKHSHHVLFFPPVLSESSSPPSVYDWVHAADVSVPTGSLVFPGSFNPVHEGHINLVLAALERYNACSPTVSSSSISNECGANSKAPGVPPSIPTNSSTHRSTKAFPSIPPLIIFEIAAVNADKPPISLDILEARLRQFDPNFNHLMQRLTDKNIPYAVAITSEPLFARKAAIFPNTTFLIGADTLERLFNLKYYLPKTHSSVSSSSAEQPSVEVSSAIGLTYLVKAMGQLADKGCRFIVGGRIRQNSSSPAPEFQTMDSIFKGDIGAQCIFTHWPDMFQGITEAEFRFDLSSTEIRKRMQQVNAEVMGRSSGNNTPIITPKST